MPGLVWHRKFTPLKPKEEEEYLVHSMFTVAVASLGNISATENSKKDRWGKHSVDQRQS